MPAAQEPAAEGTSELIATLLKQHQMLIEKGEAKLDEHLQMLAMLHEADADEVEPLEPGEFVLVDMHERPHSKINSPWSGPWQVIEHDDNDGAHPIVLCQHIASKKIERFNKSTCKRANLDLFEKVEDAVEYAARDSFEYEVEAILAHTPRGERKRKSREPYEFQVLWKGIERSETNPSWEPYSNQSLMESEPMREYCRRPDVVAELGRDFLPGNAAPPPPRR
jgi:hypothetical protein